MVYSFALTCWLGSETCSNPNLKIEIRSDTGLVRYVQCEPGNARTHAFTSQRRYSRSFSSPFPPRRAPHGGSASDCGYPCAPVPACPIPPTNPNSLHASPVFSIGHHDGSTCLPDSCVHLPGSPHPPQPLLPRSACCCAILHRPVWVHVEYSCTQTHWFTRGLCTAVLSSQASSGNVKAQVVSSPHRRVISQGDPWRWGTRWLFGTGTPCLTAELSQRVPLDPSKHPSHTQCRLRRLCRLRRHLPPPPSPSSSAGRPWPCPPGPAP